MGLHLAALAALAGDVQLATRLRHRARNREAEDRIAKIGRLEQEHFSSSNQAPSTGDSSPT
jgi:hypothetical protein